MLILMFKVSGVIYMKKTIWWLIISMVLFSLCAGMGWADDSVKALKDGQKAITTVSDTYSADELLVQFTVPQSDEKLAKKMEKIYGKETKKLDKIEDDYSSLGLPNTYLVKLNPGEDPKVAKDKYKKDPEVVYAEPNYEVSMELLPNDPSFSLLWGLHNTGQTGGTADADIDAPEAWDLCTGSADVVVAVVDTGVDYTHPDLASNIWINTDEIAGNGIDDDHNGYIDDVRGWDFYNKDNNPMDDNNHGTHCAGTIGGVGSNGIGVSGVMWNVKIMPLKFLSSSGSGYTSDAVSAILYANANGANVISNSWGGSGYSTTLKNAIDASPAVVVCAAGNSGVNADTAPMYPAAYSSANIISVAATDSRDLKASFSNYGVTSVDVAAPGVSIYSTLKGGSYGSMSGTSMATPHVAGLAGLLKAGNPALSNLEIKNLILSNCDVLPSLQGKVLTSGRINAYKALSSLQPVALSLVSVSPSTGINNNQAGVTLTGTGFKPTPTVKLVGNDGTEITATGVTVISSTTITCSFDLRTKPAGFYDVQITQGGETTTLTDGFLVQKPILVVTTLSPSSALAGGPSFTLTVSGSNFTSSSRVNWNGVSRTTTFNSATQLQIAISAADIGSPGTATITVTDSDLEPSNSKPFTIVKPVPVIAAVSPSSATAGGLGFTLTVSGSNFTPASVLNWNGTSRTTTFDSNSQLRSDISASDIAGQGTATITVTDPERGESNSKTFTILAPTPPPVPVITSLSPSSAAAGGSGFTLTVSGSNFTPASVVNWNGNFRSTTYSSSAQLQAAISSGDIATQGTATVTVTDSGRGTSNEKIFTISSSQPSPTVSSISPSTATRGSTKSLSVYGKYFVTGASVELRKTGYQPIACTNEVVTSSTKITCRITIPSSASRGYWDVMVINPDGKTGTKTRGFYIY
jgi:subtilisin family serine protease